MEGLYLQSVRRALPRQCAAAAAAQQPDRGGALLTDRHRARHHGGSGHPLHESASARRYHGGHQHPHDQPGDRDRRLSGAAVRFSWPSDEDQQRHGLYHAADRAYHLQPPVCDPFGHAQARPDGSEPAGRGDGPGMHPGSGVFQSHHPRDHARHPLRSADGLHHEPGRFRYLLFRVRPGLYHAAGGDL